MVFYKLENAGVGSFNLKPTRSVHYHPGIAKIVAIAIIFHFHSHFHISPIITHL